MKVLNEILKGKEKNYMMPFFWLHGEEESVIREYVQKVHETGMKSICVESRPHPDFLGEKWWKDLDVIIEEAEERNMTVWILDDEHFPTGYAAGKIESDFPHLRKQYVKTHQLDVVGPQFNAGILVKWGLRDGRADIMEVGRESNTDEQKMEGNEAEIIKVIAAKRTGYNLIDEESLIDITDHLDNGVVYWDIPSGDWTIFTIIQTYKGGEEATKGYLNPLIPEATDVLINTIYEAHYEKYEEKFGNTLSGFFSDEPRFGNIKGPDASIGRMDMPLPWRPDLMELLNEKAGEDVSNKLPLLFVGENEKAHALRYLYMDLVTKLYEENFSKRIGAWCEAHNVEHIGHIIEDNNAHARLGYGPGHFFRSMSGQSMAGIDVVLHQLLPGFDKGYFNSFTSSGWDGEFFHYALAKLGSSLGHLDPKKAGRTMCEVFGAYGWNEGLPMMKWIIDHMLVRGVTHFVPHAFSLKKFPDPDCPPHFYAHGYNTQYPYMNELVSYTNRISHLLSSGTHKASVALLYHAEAEWSGQYQLIQKPAREMMQHQIDFDVVPVDYLLEATIEEKEVKIANESFKTIVVPYAEALPEQLIQKLINAKQCGIDVLFVNQFPERTSEGGDNKKLVDSMKQLKVVSLNELAITLIKKKNSTVHIESFVPYLRAYRMKCSDHDIYMLSNESPSDVIDTRVHFTQMQDVIRYDAFTNKILKVDAVKQNGVTKMDVQLAAYESVIYIFGHHDLKTEPILGSKIDTVSLNRLPVEISYNGIDKKEVQSIDDIAIEKDFSGTVMYEFTINRSSLDWEKAVLNLTEANEVVEVFLNEHYIGTRICNPYTFDLEKELLQKKNKLRIKVTNTLGNQQQDFLSQYLPTKIAGLYGELTLNYYDKGEK